MKKGSKLDFLEKKDGLNLHKGDIQTFLLCNITSQTHDICHKPDNDAANHLFQKKTTFSYEIQSGVKYHRVSVCGGGELEFLYCVPSVR